MKTILIKNARVIDPSQNLDKKADLLVADGVVKELSETIAATVDETIEAEGLILAPGLVDMHVHLRDPGQTHKEDVYSGCRAAAAGGVTSLLCMPNTSPALDSPEAVKAILEKAKEADARVYVAASITKGLKSETLCDFKALKAAGAVALTDDGRPVTNSAYLRAALNAAHTLSMAVVSHCEDLDLAAGGVINEGNVSKRLGVKGIPRAAEDAGTAREIAVAEGDDVPVHICHVSTKGSVALIRCAKRRGAKVTCETAPHYFTLTEKALLARDADYRMNPPLRTEEDKAAIIEGLLDGTIDAIATDHAPHTPQEKADFLKAPNGSIGMETSLAASLTALVKPGLLSLSALIDKMSTSPARLLHIPGGTLKTGAPADIVLFDEREEWTVDPEKLHGKSKNTPFKGMTLCGKVKLTLLGGRVVYRDTTGRMV